MRNILPGRTSIRNRVAKKGKNVVEKSLEEVHEFLGRKTTIGIGLSTDIWTEPYENLPYMSLTAHYVIGRVLKSAVLALKPMIGLENKKAETIKAELDKIFESIKLKDLKRSTFVTDRGGNIVRALGLSQIHRVSCFAHLLNNLCEHAFMKNDSISKLVNAMKELVTWFKKSTSMVELDTGTTLKQESKTRFNSIKFMFESVQTNYIKMSAIVKEKKPDYVGRMNTIKMKMIEELMPFLIELEKYTKKTEGEKYPTLYQVWPAVESLSKYCTKVDKNDPNYILQMKKAALSYIKANFEITDYHKFATYLTPKYKALDFIDTQTKRDTLVKLRDFFDVIKSERSSVETETQHSDDPFAVAYDFNVKPNDKDELEIYFNMNIDVETKCLDFWFDNQLRFPILSEIAFFVHSITATSCTEERLFSAAGHIKNIKRNRINHDELLYMVTASKA